MADHFFCCINSRKKSNLCDSQGSDEVKANLGCFLLPKRRKKNAKLMKNMRINSPGKEQ